MTVLIGLNGRKQSGKNTAGNVIQKWGSNRGLNVYQRGFADALKLSAARSLGLPSATNINDAVVLMDSFKEMGWLNIEIPNMSYMQTISGREFLKWYGTEAHRDVFGKNFWLDVLLPIDDTDQQTGRVIPWDNFWANDEGFPDIAVITDVRFVNEAERVLQLGGVVVEIHRPGLESDNHASELPLPPHLITHTIENDSTLEAFEVAVNSWMTSEYHMRFVEKPDFLDPLEDRSIKQIRQENDLPDPNWRV